MKDSRTAAAIGTAIAAVLILLLLLTGRLTISAKEWPPHQKNETELVEIEEEFVDLFEPTPIHANPAPAYAPKEVVNESKPAPPGGPDLRDAGKKAAPQPETVQQRPSPVKKAKKETPEKTGPQKDAEQAEKTSRRVKKGVEDAFKAVEDAMDNTKSAGEQKGDTGKPAEESSSLNGTGHGSVGGGWIMPAYAKVNSRQTGSIILQAVVNSSGRVTSVELIGGKAPASANPRLVEQCKAEVRRHTFTRTDDNAPERSIARITYTFR